MNKNRIFIASLVAVLATLSLVGVGLLQSHTTYPGSDGGKDMLQAYMNYPFERVTMTYRDGVTQTLTVNRDSHEYILHDTDKQGSTVVGGRADGYQLEGYQQGACQRKLTLKEQNADVSEDVLPVDITMKVILDPMSTVVPLSQDGSVTQTLRFQSRPQSFAWATSKMQAAATSVNGRPVSARIRHLLVKIEYLSTPPVINLPHAPTCAGS